MEWLTEARSWVGVLVGVVIAWITAKWATKGKQIETTAAPYDKLAERVVKLETQVGELRSRVEHLEDENEVLRDEKRDLTRQLAQIAAERDRSTEALRVLLGWIDSGSAPPPPPRPAWLVTPPTLD